MTASGDTIRAFIATAISPMAREALEDTIGRLRQEIPGGVTWVRPEGIHLTLKFLGNVRRDESERLMSVVGELAAGHGPFTLGLSGLGMFPNGRRPRVLWAGLTGDLGALASLQQTVEDAAARIGLPPEARPFSPHLTLGRVRRDVSEAALGRISAAVSVAATPDVLPWPVDSVQLMRSVLHPSGAEYTVLTSVPLGRPESL